MTKAKLKVKKGDTVVVITGKDKGKQGEILTVNPSENTVVVAGVNVVKKHTKPSATATGGIITKEAAINVSNIALVDPKSGKPTRVGYSVDAKGVKTRVAKKSGEKVGN
jgi:large subunit ribosomal protein L24